jgi:O-antigen/teichoic acid export membrane protein
LAVPADRNIGKRAAVAFGWGVAGSVLKILVTLLVQAALARLLGADAYGTFALGMLVLGVAGYFADIGLATSLVQKDEVDADDVRFVFTLNLLLSAAVAVLVVSLAMPLAQFFGKPDIAPVFAALSPVFVFNALSSVSTSLLRRQLEFKHIQVANLLAYSIGFGVLGIGAAVAYGGVHALVAAAVSQAVLNWALLYAKTRHPLALRFNLPGRGRSHVGFGGAVLLTNLVNWAASSVDRLVIGRMFPSAALGHYSASYNLIYAPVNVLYPNLQSTVFSAAARMQADVDRQRKAYLDLLSGVCLVFLPLFSGVHVLAPLLTSMVYGRGWEEAGLLGSIFALMAPFLLIWGVTTPFLWNTGRRLAEVKVQAPFVVLAAAAMMLASRYSLQAMAWTTFGVFIVRTLLVVAMVAVILKMRPRSLLKAFGPSLLLSFWVYGCCALCDGAVDTARFPLFPRLLSDAVVLGTAFVAALLLMPSMLPPSGRGLIRSVTSRMPSWLRPLMTRLSAD